ncbi:glycine/D-amino acid oxidase-like deaminating enzyme [Litoreibacter ponti]|uniref:Glycine/D-amino acid oxidase-like deaminating enzyme n=1 Tax=Litoreibacter ponti TaxID=1510457 RepID=A0A2T6BNF8_9RHOB|nr:FAD-binding oxidoreductase [Litoreibacter ponti]PTX57609.1 glycine/D-amino acid oxidase-like deaminating enzyme [Litoreibacter ponti]
MPAPEHKSYDVVIVGGAMYGSSVAWWLSRNRDFGGTILVVERDPTYEFASTSHTNSCIRQQFSAEVNIRVSQFGAEFIKNFREFMQDNEAPDILLQSYGYMYLADTPEFNETLRTSQLVQTRLGAGTKHLSPEEIAQAYPFYNLDGILGANHNQVDEGYFDGGTIFDWWRKASRAAGVEFLHDEVVGVDLAPDGRRVDAVRLASGEVISCGTFVNCAGPRAAQTAAMAKIDIPVEPRKRYTFIFDAAEPLDRDLPLTIDPSGVHMRSDGRYYLAGCPPDHDTAVGYEDFLFDHSIWEEKVWPVIATRVPAFERVKLINSWVGHYAFNTLDQNAIIGPHDHVENFIFVNGFSGHGLQQSPAMGRGVAEWITYGTYKSLDLSPFGYGRIARAEKFVEKAVI